jgi:hypothetical protein
MQQGRVSSLARQHIEADVRCVIDGFEKTIANSADAARANSTRLSKVPGTA